MRDQYAGDVSDLLKFAFLRALAADDRTLGVGWYYNSAHDGRKDGSHREYYDEPKWTSLDLPLWNALRTLPEPSVKALEALPIWPAENPVLWYSCPVWKPSSLGQRYGEGSAGCQHCFSPSGQRRRAGPNRAVRDRHGDRSRQAS